MKTLFLAFLCSSIALFGQTVSQPARASGGGVGGGTITFSSTPTCTVAASKSMQLCAITLTGNVSASTMDLTNATNYQDVTWRICQDDTGGRTWTWAGNVVDGGTIDTRASTCSIQQFRVVGSSVVAASVMKTDSATNDIRTSGGLLTLPSGTDTLVGRATTDTLTNKTISGANNTLTVREADLSTTDVTTANATSSKHGLAPKLSNVSTEYLSGTGVFSTPASGAVTMAGNWEPFGDITNNGASPTTGTVYYYRFTPPFNVPVATAIMLLSASSGSTHMAFAIMDSSCNKVSGTDVNVTGITSAAYTVMHPTATLTAGQEYHWAMVGEGTWSYWTGWISTLNAYLFGNPTGDTPWFSGATAATGSGGTLAIPSSCGAKTRVNDVTRPGVILSSH